jgi:hypothetical protein
MIRQHWNYSKARLLSTEAMFSNEKPGPQERDLYEDVSREDIVAAFRTAMIGHFRSIFRAPTSTNRLCSQAIISIFSTSW